MIHNNIKAAVDALYLQKNKQRWVSNFQNYKCVFFSSGSVRAWRGWCRLGNWCSLYEWQGQPLICTFLNCLTQLCASSCEGVECDCQLHDSAQGRSCNSVMFMLLSILPAISHTGTQGPHNSNVTLCQSLQEWCQAATEVSRIGVMLHVQLFTAERLENATNEGFYS